jgi:uncharacterized protein YbjT (DUF2867 family)
MILVTGATGHVGRAVVSRLASLGHDVVAMVRDVRKQGLPSRIEASWPGLSRPSTSCFSVARAKKDVDARDERGHDGADDSTGSK